MADARTPAVTQAGTASATRLGTLQACTAANASDTGNAMPVGQFKLKWPPHWKRECRRWMAVTASVGASAATGSVMLVAYHASGNFNLKLDGTPSLSQLATLPLWQWRWPHCHCGSGAGHTATGTGSATPGTGAADTRVGCCHCVPLQCGHGVSHRAEAAWRTLPLAVLLVLRQPRWPRTRRATGSAP